MYRQPMIWQQSSRGAQPCGGGVVAPIASSWARRLVRSHRMCPPTVRCVGVTRPEIAQRVSVERSTPMARAASAVDTSSVFAGASLMTSSVPPGCAAFHVCTLHAYCTVSVFRFTFAAQYAQFATDRGW